LDAVVIDQNKLGNGLAVKLAKRYFYDFHLKLSSL
jgi:hypothetical protein